MRAAIVVGAALFTATLVGCSDDGPSEPETLLDLGDAGPGENVGLIAVDGEDGRTVEWVDRLEGTVMRLDIDDSDASVETIATIDVGIEGEQRGLLGQVIVDDRRFAAWTKPPGLLGDFEIVVGEVVDGGAGDIVWSGGAAGGGAIGGVLDEIDGDILLGLGRNTGWDAETMVGGAMLRIDPDGTVDDEAEALSVGYTNPWAFTVTDDGAVWFADNAAGPDPDDPEVDDIERIGRADLIEDRNDVPRIDGEGRAPASMVELPDGRIGICGFLDNELRAYEVVEPESGEPTELARAGTIMACNVGAAVFDDGTIVTLAQTEAGETIQILRP